MYVLRNSEGAIIGAFANLQPGIAEEYLSQDDQELIDAIKSITDPVKAQ